MAQPMNALQIVAAATGGWLVVRYWGYFGTGRNGHAVSSALLIAYCIGASICSVPETDAAIVAVGVALSLFDSDTARKIMTVVGAVLLLLLRDDCGSIVGKIYLVLSLAPIGFEPGRPLPDAQTSEGVM